MRRAIIALALLCTLATQARPERLAQYADIMRETGFDAKTLEKLDAYYSFEGNEKKKISFKVGGMRFEHGLAEYVGYMSEAFTFSERLKRYFLAPRGDDLGGKLSTIAALFGAREYVHAARFVAAARDKWSGGEPFEEFSKRVMDGPTRRTDWLRKEGAPVDAALRFVEANGLFDDMDFDAGGTGQAEADVPSHSAILHAMREWMIADGCSQMKLLRSPDGRAVLAGLTGLVTAEDGMCVYQSAFGPRYAVGFDRVMSASCVPDGAAAECVIILALRSAPSSKMIDEYRELREQVEAFNVLAGMPVGPAQVRFARGADGQWLRIGR
jgi:hypothetical protein